MELLVQLGAFFGILLLGYFVGGVIEKRHFTEIARREADTRDMVVASFGTLPVDWVIEGAEMVSGNVVVSLDYFKRFLASLRMLVGGRVRTYEPLLDRARREALLRMIESARSRGFGHVVGVRLETARLANGRKGGEGTAGVEILAYGTALRVAAAPPDQGGA